MNGFLCCLMDPMIDKHIPFYTLTNNKSTRVCPHSANGQQEPEDDKGRIIGCVTSSNTENQHNKHED